jgi:hypothetical protein
MKSCALSAHGWRAQAGWLARLSQAIWRRGLARNPSAAKRSHVFRVDTLVPEIGRSEIDLG